jgi:hypothetical protein
MTRAQVTTIAAIVLFAIGAVPSPAANAADAGVPFGCDAGKSATCYFKLFLGPRDTRIVQLLSGMKVNIPGITVGQDRYCVSVNKPPVATCARIAVNATYNH